MFFISIKSTANYVISHHLLETSISALLKWHNKIMCGPAHVKKGVFTFERKVVE